MNKKIGLAALVLFSIFLTGCSSSTESNSSDKKTDLSPTESSTQAPLYALPSDWPSEIPLPDGAELIEDPTLEIATFGEPGDKMQSLNAVAQMTVLGDAKSVYEDYSKLLSGYGYKCDFEFNSDGTYSCTFLNKPISLTAFIFDGNKDGDSPNLDGYALVAITAEYEDGLIEIG